MVAAGRTVNGFDLWNASWLGSADGPVIVHILTTAARKEANIEQKIAA